MESNLWSKARIYIITICKIILMTTDGVVLIDHFKQYFRGLNYKV